MAIGEEKNGMGLVTPGASPSISLQSTTLFIQLLLWRDPQADIQGTTASTSVMVPTLS